MKTRITALIFSVVMLAGLLSGCSCEHEWAEATCLTPKTCNLCQETEGEALGHTWAEVTCAAPKTCTACGETEGEALPHTWVEANYQDPKTCAVCSATEGEPLTADFEEHGYTCISLNGINTQMVYPYVTRCFDDPSKKTTADLRIDKYMTFSYSDSCPFKEGYEWYLVDVELRFWDENANKYGSSYRTCWEDYYDIEGHDNSASQEASEEGVIGEYTISYHGKEYICSYRYINMGYQGWYNHVNKAMVRYYFQVPVGYDGTVIGFYDASKEWEDGMYIYDIADENTLFFRLD